MNIIVVDKINIDGLVEKTIKTIEEEQSLLDNLIESRKNILAPYVGQALYAFVEAHNDLLKHNVKFFSDYDYICDATKFVNDILQNNDNWEIKISNYEVGVTFKKYKVYFWLSDNPGGMRYNCNPVYQTYIDYNNYPYDVEDYVKQKIELFIKDNSQNLDYK